MRILLATPFWTPGVGGSTRLIVAIAERLLKQGHEVVVVTYGEPHPSDAPYVVRVPARTVRGASSLAFARTVWEELGKTRFDRVLAYGAFPHAVGVSVACRLRRVPWVVFAHGEDVTVCLHDPKKAILLEHALRRADAVLANSRFTARCLARVGASAPVIVNPGIDPAPYEAVSAEDVARFRAALGLGQKKLIVTLARLEPHKGHDTVIRALGLLDNLIPDVHYLIVGKGDTDRLTSLARECGVSNRLTILPYVPDDALPTLFAACDVHAMVSRTDPVSREVEGFGMVYLEAAACGKPSVAGSQGGCPDAVVHGKTGLVVDPTDASAVATALGRLLYDDIYAHNLGAAGWARMRSYFTEAKFLDAVESVLTVPANTRSSSPSALKALPTRANGFAETTES